MQSVLQLDPRDNVLIALRDLKSGEQIEFSGKTYSLVSDIPAKHKFAASDLPLGAAVFMYGVLVGKASQPIRQGELLTLANLRHEASAYHAKTEEFHWTSPDVTRWKQRQFLGYHRLRRSSRDSQLLARCATGILRKQEHPQLEASVRGRVGVRPTVALSTASCEISRELSQGEVCATRSRCA